MAAGLFGAMGALAELGNQRATADQQAHEETVRRTLEPLIFQQQKLQNSEVAERLASKRLTDQLAQQQQPLGQPYVSGGKTRQRFLDPLTGNVTDRELAGGTPEGEPEKLYRSLMTIPGMTPDMATQATIRKYHGALKTKTVVQPDPNSATGFSSVTYDEEDSNNELLRVAVVAPRQLQGSTTVRRSYDPVTGLWSESVSERTPHTAGAAAPAGAPGGASALPASRRASLPGTAPRGGASPAAAATPSAPVAVGPYRGVQLAPTGDAMIPARPGLTESVRQSAEDILNGRDVTKIPQKLRPLAESVARGYGWKGQGSLTPAQQMQIQQVDNSLATLQKMTGLFDSTMGRMYMSAVPLDPGGKGGIAGIAASLQRSGMSDAQAQYMNALTRLRGVIGGIRSFTGANNSNATADRLLAELPNFENTRNGADAQNKLLRLRQEVAIIKRLGYFLPDESSPLLQTPATANPAPTAQAGGSRAADPLGIF